MYEKVPVCTENQPDYLQAQMGHPIKDSIWHPKSCVWLSEVLRAHSGAKNQIIRHFKETTKSKLHSYIIYIYINCK